MNFFIFFCICPQGSLLLLALVSHSFLQICSKHLFATVEIYDGEQWRGSSKKGFINPLRIQVENKPDVVKYIRILVLTTMSRASKISLYRPFFQIFTRRYLASNSFRFHSILLRLQSWTYYLKGMILQKVSCIYPQSIGLVLMTTPRWRGSFCMLNGEMDD